MPAAPSIKHQKPDKNTQKRKKKEKKKKKKKMIIIKNEEEAANQCEAPTLSYTQNYRFQFFKSIDFLELMAAQNQTFLS